MSGGGVPTARRCSGSMAFPTSYNGEYTRCPVCNRRLKLHVNGKVPNHNPEQPQEIIAQAINDDAVFTDTDGYRSIRMRTGEQYAQIALDALAAAGYTLMRSAIPVPERTWQPGDNPVLPEVPASCYPPDSEPLDPPEELV